MSAGSFDTENPVIVPPAVRSSVLVEALRARVELYRSLVKIGETTLSVRAVGDSVWLRRVLAGGSFTSRVFDRFQAYLDENWPDPEAPNRLPAPHPRCRRCAALATDTDEAGRVDG